MKNKNYISKRGLSHFANTFLRRLRLRRNNKDLLFVKLFSDKKELLNLYNALNGSNYTDPELIIVTTLDDYLYIGVKNDCSFIIGNVLNLYEHQSSLNPNMPIRGLEYFADIYRSYIEYNQLDIFGTKLIKLPTPIYIIFYNGDKETEDKFEYRLSDAFESEGGCLECVATVININPGHNDELLKNCSTLMGYSQFVDKVRKYIQEGYSRANAIDNAVVYCIEHDILKEYFLKHRSEVVRMFAADYSYRAYVKVKEYNYQRMLADKDAELADKDAELAEKDAELAEKDAELADKDAELERLKEFIKTKL